ncbi:MAG: gliding motility-associated C-terminal domain-containing protein [Chitinophagaceae bacterium]|nr:gliding motility-associated C-terminal domain-containing protein [Chitinophagaceae bacterium]
MNRAGILATIVAVFMGEITAAQRCTQLGQNPQTAFPVCGISVFSQTNVPICGDREIPAPCSNVTITDKNPFWYRFTCYTSGTLGFKITPANLSDDYDWQIFDITGEQPRAIYTDRSLFVACNWSGEPGVTGASAAGRSLSVCDGLGRPLFSAMPELIAGHEYIMIVSHFTDSQSGYTLEFGGGTADITDPKVPQMQAATAACTGNQVSVKLNKEMKCASIASDGSDFSISSGPANITNAVSPNCSEGFSTDTIVLTLDRVLEPGDYMLNVKPGSDGNSLLDNCDNNMPNGTIAFTVHQNVDGQFSYVLHEGCERDTIEFAHDGANGAHTWLWTLDAENISGQAGSKVYTSTGTKNVTLSVSNDFCTAVHTEAISIPPKIDAKFSAPDIWCANDNVTLLDNSAGNITSWMWEFGNGSTTMQQNPEPFKYPKIEGEINYRIRLTVSNATGCTDTASANVIIVGNCNILVPTAFTPNNDGKNDYLFPTNAFAADNLVFRVYNRFGQIVFESRDWRRRWDGNVNGQPQNSGTYAWSLSYTLRSTGRQYLFKGTTVLIR